MDSVERLQLGLPLPERVEMPVDGLPVAALDRPGQLEAVVDHALHQGAHAALGSADLPEDLGRGPVQ